MRAVRNLRGLRRRCFSTSTTTTRSHGSGEVAALHFREYPTMGDVHLPPVVITHGYLGNLLNWRTFSAQPSIALNRRVFGIDMRNHGGSPHVKGMHLRDAADDVVRFLDERGIDRAVLVGHSYGGKVMAATSLLFRDRVERVALVDIAPYDYNRDSWVHDDALSTFKIIERMAEIDLAGLRKAADADKFLGETIDDRATRQFLLQNLVVDKSGSARWRCNLAELRAGLTDAQGFPFDEDLATLGPVEAPALVVRGKQARFVSTEDHRASIHRYFRHAEIDELNGGHWLHISHRQQLSDKLGAFVSSS